MVKLQKFDIFIIGLFINHKVTLLFIENRFLRV
jgi:hypothetical protein